MKKNENDQCQSPSSSWGMLPWHPPMHPESRSKKPDLVCRTIWQYDKANWVKANQMLSEYHLQEDVDHSVDCALNHPYSTFMEIISDCVHQKVVTYKSNNPKWVNAELRKFIRKKRALYRKWKKSHNIDVYNKYKSLRNKLCNKINMPNKCCFLFVCLFVCFFQ